MIICYQYKVMFDAFGKPHEVMKFATDMSDLMTRIYFGKGTFVWAVCGWKIKPKTV